MVRNFLLILATISLWSQLNAKAIHPVDLANALQKAGSYNAAITEYKRHLYFSNEDDQTAEINRQIGLCYRSLGNWTNATCMLHKAIDWQESDSLRSIYYLDLAVTHIASGNYSAAELRLSRLSSFTQYNSVRQRASFLLLVAYVYQGKWDACHKALDSGLALWEDKSTTSNILSLLKESTKSKKSPSKAKWLSTFIPGLGQLYAGHPFQALNAAGLNAFFGYYLYDQITSNGSVLDFSYWLIAFHRFWSGNRNKAPRLIHQDRIEKDTKTQQELLNALNSLFK